MGINRHILYGAHLGITFKLFLLIFLPVCYFQSTAIIFTRLVNSNYILLTELTASTLVCVENIFCNMIHEYRLVFYADSENHAHFAQ